MGFACVSMLEDIPGSFAECRPTRIVELSVWDIILVVSACVLVGYRYKYKEGENNRVKHKNRRRE